MDITWFGQSAFKIKTKTATIVIDPFSPEIGLPWKEQEADILLVSHDHKDHNNVAGAKADFVARGPGEYEVKEVLMEGVQLYHDAVKGAERGTTVAYVFEAEGVTVCHLGDLGHKLTPEQAEALESVDVLLIPVGGNYTIDGNLAAEVVSQVEPRIVIPMHYKIEGLKSEIGGVDDFMKAMGKEMPEKKGVLKVNGQAGLPSELEVVVMEPAR